MKKLNNTDLYQLLYILKFNGALTKLVRNNISYIDIVNNIKNLTTENILNYVDQKITLTEKGENLFEKLSITYKSKNKDEWIVKESKSKLEEKIDIDFVYLPDQSKIFF
ncbi:hypothetical protein JET18_04805 [Chryseobacterium sp. L7]|uniref:ArnR1-like winged helix-turn-helix domain-containing protein n=1 Tax=Chryseobacterium endalhagicum TaxID=2797638 RepID=A0ABS1QBZ4_9FLAO|nr:hypothetical protein [Chryseobacterium endalhagicum]MBL1220145.1 hypothetical protein [Chryseobacterium endalhagicum]